MTKKKSSKTLDIVILLALVLIGSVVATQVLASKFAYHPSLGKPLFSHFYQPFAWIEWYMKYHTTHYSTLVWGITAFISIVGIGMLALIIKVQLQTRSSKAIDDLHGSAHWAIEDEIKDVVV